MLVGLIIVSIIAFLAVAFLIALAQKVDILLEELVHQPNLYPCELLIQICYNQKEEQTIVDFSRYEEHKQVGLILHKKDPPSNEEEKLIDGKLVHRPHAAVYQVGDQWLWKFG